MKTLLSLFDYTGNWARPFAEAGWNVILWDHKHDPDMFSRFGDINDASVDFFYEHIFDNYGTIDGILIAQPCTDFAVSGARWWKEKDEDGRTQASINMVYISLGIVELCMPDFWVLENPVGRIHKLVPELGKPKMYFHPCDFGHPYTKKTALYGDFNTDLVNNPVEPTEGSKMWMKYGGNSKNRQEMRSVTPEGFATAFCDANKDWCREYVFEDDATIVFATDEILN